MCYKYINHHFYGCLKLNNYLFVFFVLLIIPFTAQIKSEIIVGAERKQLYLNYLEDKNIALVGNQTSLVNGDHLVDVLLNEGVNIQKVFSPEHGFRGKADAGEKVKDNFDEQTGLPIFSLYGKSKRKPSKELLRDVDVVIFDLQDVGVRFYTYISTLHYVMEACAENNVQIILLDRPNPNGFYIDGPILDSKYSSFVGMHSVPVVHGLTIGEYAKMINGEKWLNNEVQCSLKVIPCENYDHLSKYVLPVAPSPNLPNMTSVYLYPSLCFFEGTNISIGRGTSFPFQVYGAPYLKSKTFTFIPKSMSGAKYPKHKELKCFGENLQNVDLDSLCLNSGLNYNWLVECYKSSNYADDFFNENNFFNLLAGTDRVMNLIKGRATAKQIIETFQEELQQFKLVRKKYLIYQDFE